MMLIHYKYQKTMSLNNKIYRKNLNDKIYRK